MKLSRSLSLPCCALLLGLAAALPARAQSTITWGNTGTDFNDFFNWSGFTAPGSSDTALFSNSGPLVQPNVTADRTLTAVRFTSTGWTLSGTGGSLTLLTTNGGASSAISATIATNVTVTVSANLTMGASFGSTQTFAVGTTNTITFDGVVSSTNNITLQLANQGIFVLNGANTYTGTTTWNRSENTTILGNKAAFGTSAVNFNQANTIKAGADLTGANQITNAATINADVKFKNDLGYNLEFGGAISLNGGSRNITSDTGTTTFSGAIDNGSLTLLGVNGGKFVFAGANTYAGGTTVTSATLTLGSATTMQSATGALTVNGGTLDSSVSNTTLGSNLTLTSGSISPNGTSAGSLTLASGMSFTMSAGTLNLTLGSSFDQIVSAGSGTLSLSGGTINFDPTGAGFSYASSYQIFSGFGSTSFASLSLTGYDTSGYSAAISDAGVLTFSASAIPEPSTYAACVGALTLGFAAWRRRRSQGAAPAGLNAVAK